MQRFNNKTILITGAASGIGAACARRLHGEGANVVALDVHQNALDALADSFSGTERLHCAQLDVTDYERVKTLIPQLAASHPNLSGLINCAGIRGIGTWKDYTPEQWKRVVEVNLDGTFYTCQAFAQALVDAGSPGAIVNISSTAGLRAIPNRLAYVAAKMGVSGITQAMSLEMGPLGIRVNAIAPGVIRTPMVQSTLDDSAKVKQIEMSYPLGRIGEPEDIAGAAAFLLSEDASFITGVILPVDGGTTAGRPAH